MELGSRRELDSPLLQLFLSSCFPDIVFEILLRTAFETAISKVPKLLRTGGGPHLFNIVILLVADGLFGLCETERADELFTSSPPPPPPSPPHPQQHVYLLT